jgi:hypothetical protein
VKSDKRQISASFIGGGVRSRRVVEYGEGWLCEYARTRNRMTSDERTRGDAQVVWCEQLGEWGAWACATFASIFDRRSLPATPRMISAETSWLLAAVRDRQRQPREQRVVIDHLLGMAERLVSTTMQSAVYSAHTAIVGAQLRAAVAARVEGYHAHA